MLCFQNIRPAHRAPWHNRTIRNTIKNVFMVLKQWINSVKLNPEGPHTRVNMLQGHEAGTGPFVYNVGTFKKPRRKTPTKTSLENIRWRYLYYFAIIPIRSTCTMWPNYPVTEPVGTAFTEVETVAYSRVSQNLEFDHFTLLIGRAR